jgi:hypothetical protein
MHGVVWLEYHRGPATRSSGTGMLGKAVANGFPSGKCVVIQISSKRSTISANYTLHNKQLDVVDSNKYLGVTINKNLRWDNHIDQQHHSESK